MKKLLLIALIGFLLAPTLVNAEWGISWYKNYKVEKNITPSITAGSTDTIIVSFKNPTPSIGTLIAVLNVKEDTGNYPVWLKDFKVRASLNSTSLYPGNLSRSFETNCLEKTNGTFYCFNLTDIEILKCFKAFNRMFCLTKDGWVEPQGSFIVLPGSKNNLTLYMTFNPALIPANYTFNVSLFNDLLIPSIIDPLEHPVQAGVPKLFNTSEADTLLWVTTSENKSLSVDVILYEYIVGEPFSPPGLIPIKFVGIEANDTENITSTEIRIYYDDEEIPTWVDESSLKIYYYNDTDENPDNWDWQPVDSGVNTAESYVWAKTNHLSLFGIFGSPTKEIVQLPGRTVYTGGAIVYQNVTQNVTVEKEVEKPVYIEKEVPAKPVCGNGICEVNETQTNCCIDCGCSQGYECRDNACVKIKSEVPAITPSPLTGLISFAASPTGIGITLISLIIVILIAIYIFYQKRR